MKKIVILLGIVLFSISMTEMASAAILINGDFESPRVSGNFVTYSSEGVPSGFTWYVANTGTSQAHGAYGVDHIGTHWNGASGLPGDQSVDIDFDTIIYQTFTSVPGQTYAFSFAYANNPDKGTSAAGSFGVFDTAVFMAGTDDYEYDDEDFLLNGELTHSTSARSNMDFYRYNGRFTAVSDSTTLGFAGDIDNEYWGFVVDDVNVYPVPEPASMSLLGIGLLGALGAVGFRKKK